MNRLKDYLGFSVRFVGLGYIVLWPLSTPGRGDLFGAAIVCHDRVGRALDLVCNWPHPLHLSIGLHMTGALCALLATSQLLVVVVRRARRPRAGAAVSPSVAATAEPPVVRTERPLAPIRARRRPMPPPRKGVPPRTHFGLRGLPQ